MLSDLTTLKPLADELWGSSVGTSQLAPALWCSDTEVVVCHCFTSSLRVYQGTGLTWQVAFVCWPGSGWNSLWSLTLSAASTLLCFTQFPGLGSCTYVSGVGTWRPPVPQKGSVRVASFVISGPLNSCHRCWLVFNHSWLCLEWDPFSYNLGNRTWFYFTIVLSWSGWMLGLRRINTEAVVFRIKLYVYNIHPSL